MNARQHESVTLPDGIIIRPASTHDVRGIRKLIESYVEEGRIVRKPLVELFEAVQEFLVAEADGEIVACGALHVMWEDLGEIRTMAVAADHLHKGLGGIILEMLIDRARSIGLSRLFCLTFETDFFARHGFQSIAEAPVSSQVYEALLESRDEGVAEMLGLERVKPNTLGNTRMLRFI